MSNKSYQIKQTGNDRWGIYIQERLLATVGSYEVGLSLQKSLNDSLSLKDNLKEEIAYRRSLQGSLIIN